MPEQIIVKHEIDLGQLERFEKALKEFKDSGDVKKVVRQLAEMGELKDKINKKTKEELGIVGKLEKEYKELRAAQKLPQTEKELKAVNKRLREVGTELKKAKETTSTWTKALGSFAFKFNALGNIAANVTSTISRKLNQAFKEAVKTITEFESAMAGVKAISGATASEFKKLRDDAVRLGGSTIYTARAVALLQMNYAKLGFSVKEILNATEATLSLAAATDEDLAAAALVAGSTLRAFGLEAIETRRVVDVMAKSFTSSALNLDHWRESMKFAAAVAKAAGLNVETTAAAFSILADTGIKGSIAGTSLKNTLIRMATETSALSKKIGFAVKNSDDFIRALIVLKESHLDLTEAFALTDRRAAPALLILSKMADKVEEMADIYYRAFGAASEMAEIRMDTLKGSLTILKSAWEGLIISVESGHGILTRYLRSAIDSVTFLINKLKELSYTAEQLFEVGAAEEAGILMTAFERTLWGTTREEREVEVQREIEAADKIMEDFKKRAIAIEIVLKNWVKEYPEIAIYLASGQISPILETALKATGKWKEFKTITETLKKAELDLSTYEKYIDRLMLMLSKTKIEGIELELEMEEESFKLWKEQESLRIAGIKEGVDKEIALNDYKFKILIHRAEAFGMSIADITERWKEENIRIAQKYNKRIILDDIEWNKKALKKIAANANKDLQRQRKVADLTADILYEQTVKVINLMDISEDEKTELIRKANNERKKLQYEYEIWYYNELKKWYPEQIELLDLQIKKIKARIENFADEIKEEEEKGGLLMAIFPEMKPDQEKKITTQLLRLGNFALDTLRDINADRQRIADMAVDRYNQEVDELQRTLEIELELSKKGKANRIQQVQEELAETKKLREKAMEEQERLMKQQQKIESTVQALNLATTISELLKAAGLSGPLFLVVAPLLVGAMFKLWRDSIGKIQGELPKFAEGVIGYKGEGTETSDSNLVRISNLETITPAKLTKKYRNVLEGIHSDDINAIWEAVTNDRTFSSKSKTIVNVDLDKTNKLLGEIVQHNKEMPKNFGSYVEYVKDGIIYRIKFNDRKN